jgi:hypothetical protein
MYDTIGLVFMSVFMLNQLLTLRNPKRIKTHAKNETTLGLNRSLGYDKTVFTPGFINRGSARDRDLKKNKHSFLNLIRSTEKHHSLLKRALTVIIGLLYLQLTDHANVP